MHVPVPQVHYRLFSEFTVPATLFLSHRMVYQSYHIVRIYCSIVCQSYPILS